MQDGDPNYECPSHLYTGLQNRGHVDDESNYQGLTHNPINTNQPLETVVNSNWNFSTSHLEKCEMYEKLDSCRFYR